MISRLPIGIVKPKVVSPSVVLCIEASGEESEEAEDFFGHLLFVVVLMVFVGPVVIVWFLVGRIEVKSSVVPVWGWWPFAVRLLMRHGVGAVLGVSPEQS